MPPPGDSVPAWQHAIALLDQKFEAFVKAEQNLKIAEKTIENERKAAADAIAAAEARAKSERKARDARDQEHREAQRNLVEMGFKALIGLIAISEALSRLRLGVLPSVPAATIQSVLTLLGVA